MTALMLDPGTLCVAAPELQLSVGGDPRAASRFPATSRVSAITPGMGLFFVTSEQLASLIQRARAGGAAPTRRARRVIA
jgi:hypothetical protein